MNALPTTVRWAARITALISIGLLAFFLFGGDNGPLNIGAKEAVLLVFFPIGAALGMALGWWRELMGGLITLGALAIFYGMHLYWYGYLPEGPYFAIFCLPGALFLISWILSRNVSGNRKSPAAEGGD